MSLVVDFNTRSNKQKKKPQPAAKKILVTKRTVLRPKKPK